MDNGYLLSAVMIMVMVNYLTRALPFIFFGSKTPPAYVLFLENYFPPIIMTILVFYSLGDIDLHTAPYGSYELLSVAVTISLHLLFKNYLLSIFGATLFYMGLVQHWFGT